MGGFKNDIKVNRSTELWKTCMHEGAHVAADELFGYTVTKVEILSPDIGGTYLDSVYPRGYRKMTKAEYFMTRAVASLAGPVISEQLAFWSPKGCDTDREHARRYCTQGEIEYADALDQAKRLVSQYKGRIKKNAEIYYVEYVKGGGRVA